MSVLSTQEIPPTEEELAELRAQKGGFFAAVGDIGRAILVMPVALRKLALVYLFQWYAPFIYWQFVAFSIADSVDNATNEERGALLQGGRLDRPGQRLLQHHRVPVGLLARHRGEEVRKTPRAEEEAEPPVETTAPAVGP